MNWDDLTTTDFAGLDRRTPVVLPVAATEQHGPHLPVSTDRRIAEHFTARLNDRLGRRVLVLPTVAVGCSDHHMGFLGSLTLRHETFLAVGLEYLRSAHSHGFRRFLVLNAHGGNQGIGQVMLERFGRDHPDALTALATWWKVPEQGLADLNTTGPGGVGHACEFETSLMLLIAPDLVRMDQARPKANVPTFAWAENDLLRGPRVALYRTFKQMTPIGAFGDPTAASAEAGRAITERVVAGLVEILDDLASAPDPDAA